MNTARDSLSSLWFEHDSWRSTWCTLPKLVTLTVCLIVAVYATNLLVIVLSLVKLAMTFFCIFSFFTWFYLLYAHFNTVGSPKRVVAVATNSIISTQRDPYVKVANSASAKNTKNLIYTGGGGESTISLDDKLIFFIFLFFFFVEFFMQFVLFNMNSTLSGEFVSSFSNETYATTDFIDYVYSLLITTNGGGSGVREAPAAAETDTGTRTGKTSQLLFILMLISPIVYLIFVYFESNLSRFNSGPNVTLTKYKYKLVAFVLFICLVRFYGIVYLETILPESICAYFVYFCALAGILFSHYIQFIISSRLLTASSSSSSSMMIDNFLAANGYFAHNDNGRMFKSLYETSNLSNAGFNTRQQQHSKNSRNNSNIFKRRTSLPTFLTKFDKNVSSDYLILREIHAIIDDLMSSNENHTINLLVNALKNIKDLINRQTSSTGTTLTSQNAASSSHANMGGILNGLNETHSHLVRNHYHHQSPTNKVSSLSSSSKLTNETSTSKSTTTSLIGNGSKMSIYSQPQTPQTQQQPQPKAKSSKGHQTTGARTTNELDYVNHDESYSTRNNNDDEFNSYSADEEEENRSSRSDQWAYNFHPRQQSQLPNADSIPNANNNNSVNGKKFKYRNSLPTHFSANASNSNFNNFSSSNSNNNSSVVYQPGASRSETSANRQRSSSLKYSNLENSKCLQSNAAYMDKDDLFQLEKSATDGNNCQQLFNSPLQMIPSTKCSQQFMDEDTLSDKSNNSNNSNAVPATAAAAAAAAAAAVANSQINIDCNNFYDEDEEPTTSSSLNSNVSSQNKTSDYESGESPTNSDYNSDTDKLQLKNYSENSTSLHHQMLSKKRLEQIKEELSHCINRENNTNSNSNANVNDKLWQVEDIRNLYLLNFLHKWSFPIFEFGDCAKNFVLSKMTYKIFDEVGLFRSFDIPVDKFINYFVALENGYIDLPYHNRTHAADVLHACYYFTTQAVPGYSNINNELRNHLSTKRMPLNPYQYSLKYSLNEHSDYGPLGANFTPLEILALYCSAAMHDYEHPGRNNQFLITIKSPLALLYNDKSVLENHHASSSWQLLKSNPKYNFLSSLDAVEWKRFRHLIIENILATDLGRHFTIINEFNSKFNKSRPLTECKIDGVLSKPKLPYDFECAIDWKNENDRLIVAQMILKLADINAPLKECSLHVQWTNRIVQEFFAQGDEESSLGLNISPFMDRRAPEVEKLQENFINKLVGSLTDAYTFAGLLPGTVVEASSSNDPNNGQTGTSASDASSSSSSSFQDLTLNKSESTTTNPGGSVESNSETKIAKKTLIFESEMIKNFKSNYQMWCDKLKQENIS